MATPARPSIFEFLPVVLIAAALAVPSVSEGAVTPGAIPASFGVGNQGEASYTIPIAAPAATGGLKPNIALSYNHLAGDGLAGMRWQLAGLSAIARCRQTYAQDGQVFPINYGSTERFCLDGRRLVNLAGGYGASGTEYRTEIESFQRVFQQGVVGGGPQSFYVQHGDGSTSYYGYTSDSRVEAVGLGGAVRLWYLSSTVDQFGNQINYTYSENGTTGEVVPTEITWTSNSLQGLSARYKIAVTYETRPSDDQRSGHDSGGAPWASTKRIDKIDVIYNGTTTINTYNLTYTTPTTTGTQRSQLERVSLCRGADCVPETVFTLQNGTRGWGSLTNTNSWWSTNPLVGDMNGDGRQDVFFCLSGGTWQVHPGQADGLFAAAINSGVSCATTPEQARVIDYNGDGRMDLLYPSGASWYVLQSTGSGFTNVSVGGTGTLGPFADIDGDGLSDVVYQSGDALYWSSVVAGGSGGSGVYYPSGQLYGFSVVAENPTTPMDANGDGRADLVIRVQQCYVNPNDPCEWYCENVYYLLLSSGTGFETFTEFHLGTMPDSTYYTNFRAADVNGDGLHDLLYTVTGGPTWSLRLSRGTTLGPSIGTGIPATNPDKVMIVDYDGDGRDDLVRADGNSYLIHRSNGTTLPSAYTDSLASPGASTATAFAADISGDGFPEIVRVSGSTWHTHKHNSPLPDVVTTFTDGLGNSVDPVYEPLANAPNYWIDPNDVPPAPYVRKYSGSRHVVTQERHDNGLQSGDTEREFNHHYQTAYIDVSGRGWSSFLTHVRTDVDQGTYTVAYFNRSWPYVGITEFAGLVKVGEAKYISSSNPVFDKTTWTSTTPNRHFVRVESTTTSGYEIGGIADGQHLRTIVDDPSYDTTYGHVTTRTTTITDPVTSETWTSTTNFNPTADTDDWCLGQPGLVETTNTLPNFTSAVRKINHTWNLSDCSLTETTEQSETSGAKQLKTTFTYDVYGNPNLVSQDSADTTAQNRSTDFNFDSFGQYPSSVTVGTVNLTTQFTWDYLTGQRESVTGPDLLTTTWLYDPLGRLAEEIRPVGSTTFSYTACGACWPQNAVLFARAQDTGGSDDYEFFDELGRTVGSSWKTPLGNEGRQETRYNVTGRVEKVSQPYVYFESVFWTQYYYDLIGRLTSEDAPVSELQPNGATTVHDYRGHDLWITDAESNTTKYTHNAARQIKQVIDAMNGTTAYTYKPFGELATLTDAEFNTTTIGYDARGFKTSLADPNMGSWTYDTNVYGELTHQRSPMTTAPAWTTTLAYDEAGRLSTRAESEGTTTWTYYTTGAGAIGKIDTIGGPGNAQKYTYSTAHGQPTQIRHTVDGTNYFYDMTFDGQARLNLLTYPTSGAGYRFAVDYDYDTWGHLTVAKDGNTPSLVYYELDGADAVGRELTVTLGNGLHEYRDYDRASGHLSSIQTDPGMGAAIQNLSFSFDEVGNVLTRTNANIGKNETFTYDDLNRLHTSQVGGLSTVTMGYSAAGRIESKTDVGSYIYSGGCGGGPMAVKSAAGKTYCYDAAGRMTSRGGSAITWYSYDLPNKIDNGSVSTEFTYGVDRARITQTRKVGSTPEATIRYIGQLLESETAGGTTTWRHYVSARGRVVAQVNRVDSTNTVQYLHRDHQSSVVEITNASGATVQSLAFDPWGLRRNPANWAPLGSPFGGTQPTKRGYTGHEHLDNVELIHMNGRVQDPRIGLFISADPFVQAPYHSQSHNRYAYVWNNPASLVDPSGFQGGCPPKTSCSTIPGEGSRLEPGECERRNLDCRDRGATLVCADYSTCWVDVGAVEDSTGSTFVRDTPDGNDEGGSWVWGSSGESRTPGEIVVDHLETTVQNIVEGMEQTAYLNQLAAEGDDEALRELVQRGVPFGPGGVTKLVGARQLAARAATNWKSVKQFGHTFSQHGAGARNTGRLIDRARGTGAPQGQWLNNEKAAEALRAIKVDGPATVRIPQGLGQVIRPDGSIVPTEWARVVPSADGLRTAFPVIP